MKTLQLADKITLVFISSLSPIELHGKESITCISIVHVHIHSAQSQV